MEAKVKTREEKKFIAQSLAILEAVVESGDRGLPSGHLYASIMSLMSFEEYNRVICFLLDNGFITQNNWLLKATVKATAGK